jgi:hypothetical protein
MTGWEILVQDNYFFVHDRFPVDLENSRNKQSPKEIENKKSKKVKGFKWDIIFKIMNFEIIILVIALVALVVVFSVFLAFLAFLAFFKFCSFMDCKSGEALSTFYQVEEVEQNITKSVEGTLISRPTQLKTAKLTSKFQ